LAGIEWENKKIDELVGESEDSGLVTERKLEIGGERNETENDRQLFLVLTVTAHRINSIFRVLH